MIRGHERSNHHHAPTRLDLSEVDMPDDELSEGDDTVDEQALTLSYSPAKVTILAEEIAAVEARKEELEERFIWLQERMTEARNGWIQRSTLGSAKTQQKRFFRGWNEAMQEMRLERGIEEQIDSIEECKTVIKRLELKLEEEHHNQELQEETIEETQRLYAHCDEHREVIEEQRKRMENLEKRMRMASSCIHGCAILYGENIVKEYDKFEKEGISLQEQLIKVAHNSHADLAYVHHNNGHAHGQQHGHNAQNGSRPISPSASVAAPPGQERSKSPRFR